MTDDEDFLSDVDARTDPDQAGARKPVIFSALQVVTLVLISAIIAGFIGYQLGLAGGSSRATPDAASTFAQDEASDSAAHATPQTPPSTSAPVTTSPSPSPTGEANATYPAQEFLDLLATIPAKGRAPGTGYQREGEFGEPWIDIDGNGCRTRDDILKRDLTDITIRPGTEGCVVTSGTLDDPYTGARISFLKGQDTSALVQIDHVVPLYDAWQKGAQQWSQEKRIEFANDPRNLIAVDGSANQSKGASDAATWLPPNRGYWCEYAQRIVVVKAAYGVWVTSAEKVRLEQILRECP